MFSHVAIGSNDLETSKKFYDALFTALGGQPGTLVPDARIIYRHMDKTFIVTKPIDGSPACAASGGTLGFLADSEAHVDAWHAAGVAAGGVSIEDAPGWRGVDPMRMYRAYLRDPDGNKICTVYRP